MPTTGELVGNVTTALILGKFLPPHRGRRHLAEEARLQADEVIVCLLANSAEPIPVELRRRFPVSSTAIRSDPCANLHWLDEPVRGWYAARLD